ncbi:hypothetical protein ACFU3O_36535 [Streptomyces antibioticus]|uniref:hypothetical protein n=1 Tax=Streptomyces antibioticus TaxID=1890 RepID=UPI0036B5FF79
MLAGQATLHTGDQSGLEISATVDRAYTPSSRYRQVLRLAREVYGPLVGRAAEHLGLTGQRIPTAEAAEGLAAWVGGIVEATRLEDRTRTPTLYGACCGELAVLQFSQDVATDMPKDRSPTPRCAVRPPAAQSSTDFSTTPSP